MRTELTSHKFHPLIAWVGCLCLAWFLQGCSRPSNVETALDENILHFGLGAEPQHLDPHLATSVAAHNILSALLEGLVSEHPETLKPVPGVAHRWEKLEEGKTYLFYLRDNALWSNGDPVTAHDFVYSFRRILNPNLGAQYGSMLQPLKNPKLHPEGKKTWEDATGATTTIAN